MYSRILLFSFLLFVGITKGYAQNNQQTTYNLARQAEQNGELEKAIEYYETLYKQSPSDTYYRALLELYPQIDDFHSAEKLTKKQIRKNSNRGDYVIDLGHIYELQKEEKDAQKQFNQVIDNMGSDQQEAHLLANRFNQYGNYNYVEEVYLKSRKLNRNNQLFRFELANAYAQLGKSGEMIDEYLGIVGQNTGYIQTVQNIFQRILYPDPDGKQHEVLRNQLLKRIQSQPDVSVYSELLIWLYIQDKNFEGAFIQARALDKRESENGRRLISLGKLALSNKAYDAAEKSFAYVVGLGENQPYFLTAKMSQVEALKEKITENPEYSHEDIEKLHKIYDKSLKELGKSATTLPLLKGKAELFANYLNQIDSAIAITEGIIQMNGIEEKDRAEAKISLADLLIINHNIWDASLLYSQVEKSFKYDQIGEIAKFKNAKIAFYTGDFYWAQAQLNVLKGSTSKLIANDAMELSLLITDNVGLDSIEEPLRMYARADLALARRNYEKANKSLDSIPKFFPESSLKDEVLFQKFKIEKAQQRYERAAEYLRTLIADYGEDILGDNALFELAKLEEEQFGNKEKAMKLYQQLLTTYPASLFVIESRKRFRLLRGDNLKSSEIPKEEGEL